MDKVGVALPITWAGIPYVEAVRTVNPLANASVGSTPTQPTNMRH